MSVLDWLRKGFGYVLLSMGVSRPEPRPTPSAKPSSEPAPKPKAD
jgi:hypothetical protein